MDRSLRVLTNESVPTNFLPFEDEGYGWYIYYVIYLKYASFKSALSFSSSSVVDVNSFRVISVSLAACESPLLPSDVDPRFPNLRNDPA